ncbi:methyl-accepting chemotaxis protein [Anaerosporobacter faecicola]|uniref:methyl-accepting chemotaxis protein n=1 Tax=Anaerosporobacter faecicola TaxID=2718714 RepID=UPI001439EE79|nr:methyl-accepting chemotaxis protein [Anaerosporobacter faecicola]
MEKRFSAEAINVAYAMFPIISELYDHNVCLAVTDTERYLFVQQGKEFNIPFHTGDILNPSAVKVIQSGKNYKVSLPKEMVETDTTCYFFPLREEEEVVGLLTIAVDESYRNELVSIMDVLYNSIGGISKNIQNIADGFKELTTENEELLQEVHDTAERGKDTTQIVSLIHNISAKTNLLGLNASIEAARAGDSGLGFAVVAAEITKLAANTKESIKKIGTIIQDIVQKVDQIDEGLEKNNQVSAMQAESFENILESIKTIDNMVKKLHEISQKI